MTVEIMTLALISLQEMSCIKVILGLDIVHDRTPLLSEEIPQN
jgi:hypothetical protein